jgi:hypothetical protein
MSEAVMKFNQRLTKYKVLLLVFSLIKSSKKLAPEVLATQAFRIQGKEYDENEKR